MRIAELRNALETFEASDHLDESTYDDWLDDCYPEVSYAGQTCSPSYALKELDPIAYRCGFSDYADGIDIEEIPEYAELVEELVEAHNDQGVTYSVTYDRVDPEGETETDSGFDEEDESIEVDEDDVKEAAEAGEDAIVRKCIELIEDLGATDQGNTASWWYTPDAEIDPHTGEHTTRAIHFAGLLPEQEEAIAARIR